MARKKTNMIEDIFDLIGMLPWWGGLIVAGMFWLVGVLVTGGNHSQLQNSILPLIKFAFNGLAFISLFATVVSFVKKESRRELLDKQRDIATIRNLSWQQFEHLVGEAYRRKGYSVLETGGGGADGGVDLILRSNGKTVLVQCKRWKTQSVGVDKVRELFGVVIAEKATGGILVSSGNFTNAAQSFAEGKPITLVDGRELTRLVQDVKTNSKADVSVPPVSSAPNQKPACPRCGIPMVIRTARKGTNSGAQFYGCSNFPRCRGTKSLD